MITELASTLQEKERLAAGERGFDGEIFARSESVGNTR